MVSSSQIETVELSKLGLGFIFIPCERPDSCLSPPPSLCKVLLAAADVEALLRPEASCFCSVVSALGHPGAGNAEPRRGDRSRLEAATSSEDSAPSMPPEKCFCFTAGLALLPASPLSRASWGSSLC